MYKVREAYLDKQEAAASGRLLKEHDPPQHYTEGEKLIISCYFALTTLSTVGYGDLYPVSPLEKLITIVI